MYTHIIYRALCLLRDLTIITLLGIGAGAAALETAKLILEITK